MSPEAFFLDSITTELIPKLLMVVLTFAVVVGISWYWLNKTLRN